MGSTKYWYRCCWSLSLLSLLLISCGKSEREQDNSVKGQLERAMKIENLGLRSKKLLSIADTQIELEDSVNGKVTIELAADTAKEVKDPYDRGAALNSVAYAFAKHDLKDKSSDALKEAYRTVPDIEEADRSVAVLAKMGEIQIRFLEQVNTGEQMFEEAATLAAESSNPEQKLRAKMNLAFHLDRVKRGEVRDELIQDAFEALEQIVEPRDRSETGADLASRLLQLKLADLADQAFNQAEKDAASIQDPLSQGYALCEIGSRLLKAKRTQAAQRVFDRAKAVAEKVTDKGLRTELLKRITDQK